jgi:hypothetical protein
MESQIRDNREGAPFAGRAGSTVAGVLAKIALFDDPFAERACIGSCTKNCKSVHSIEGGKETGACVLSSYRQQQADDNARPQSCDANWTECAVIVG